MSDLADPVPLLRDLIRCPSVTPEDAGALDVLAAALERLGFACHDLAFSEPGTPDVRNLYARLGGEGPNFCFAGHTDVVPVGDRGAWTHDPFGAEIAGGRLYGRGAVDMKGAIAAFVAATAGFLAQGRPRGSISLLITGDEEGPAINGTPKLLRWLAGRGERLDACLVGEPTSAETFGDMLKIGRRGSLNAHLVALGTQGHVAYPQQADNPVHRLVRMLASLIETPLDAGTAHFEPSSLQLTTIDVGNPTTNLIPTKATAGFNIRFNDAQSGAGLERALRERLAPFGPHELTVTISGESFLTPPGRLSDTVAAAVESVCGRRPTLSTSGGTSDARFIRHACPVVEFGLRNATAHKADEHVPLAELEDLTRIYAALLDAWVR